MPKLTSVELKLKKLKRRAHHYTKTHGLAKHEALEQVAQEEGFGSWRDLKQRITFNSPPDQENISKRYFHEVGGNSGVPPEGFIGMRIGEDGKPVFQHRESHLSFVGDSFNSASEFRTRLEEQIKSVISNSKGHFLIAVKVYIDNDIASLLKNPDAFFPAIVKRYDRLHAIVLEITEIPLMFGTFSPGSIFEELYGPLPEAS